MSSDDCVPAVEPEDLGRFFVERVNAGDVEGLVALYEPDAVMAFPPGNVATGSDAIRGVYKDLVASGVKLTPGDPQPTLRVGDLALTSTRLLSGSVTAEVARRQPDGTWRWVIDQPNISGQ
jgi:ketosteroid isomerase-like protein